MSRRELQAIVDRSSTAERLFLAAYLRHLANRDDSTVSQEIAGSHREIQRGRKINLRGLKSLHQMLSKSGLLGGLLSTMVSLPIYVSRHFL